MKLQPSDEAKAMIRQTLKGMRSKRARTVVEHILQHGNITSIEIEELYGYKHPPTKLRFMTV